MNVRLRKIYNWTSGLIWDDEFMINHYTATLDIVTQTQDPEMQNTAYQRMNYWIYQVMQDAVLIGSDSERLSAYQATGQRLIVLPDAAVDQLVGMMLFCKINAMMEQRMHITDLEISSRVGDEMSYLHSAEENLGPFSHAGWWHDHGPKWSDAKARKTKHNVIAINRAPEWKDLDLEWNPTNTDQSSDVLFASFRRDEDQPIQ